MEKRIHELYNPEITAEALRRFGADGEATPLDGFENFIYSYQRGGVPAVLRIGHELHRSPEMAAGEMDWIHFLAQQGVSVPDVIPSLDGQQVEVIPAADGSRFSAVSFTFAPGQHAARAEWESGLMVKVGRLVGRMNRLAINYQPVNPAARRPHCLDDQVDFDKFLPEGNDLVKQRYHALLDHLRALPTTPDVYGMIHQDVHGGNFFVHEGEITLFDFDDCMYGWYAYDAAMAIFYTLSHNIHTPAEIRQAQRSYGEFMEGYTQEYELSKFWIAEIPNFFKLREIDLYIAIHRSMDVNNLDPWCASFMANRKEKIEQEQPFAPLDFTTL
ncbi:MAG TPA: phosphotransferase [Anaerolineaceae bacterium]|nr:phosphotransferase [Anaerolineaceae bacterium]HPN51416.1 phosphotransferase [Anaerolineaceae bacterium]